MQPFSIDMVDWLCGHLQSELIVVDVGARWGPSSMWRSFAPRVKIIGFEPDAAECARLAKLDGEEIVYVPSALGPQIGSADLHITAESACSSIYPPIDGLIKYRPELACTAPVGQLEVAMITLDSWFRDSAFDHVDVIKLDTQGSELGVLQGSSETLASVLMIEVEVEFNEIYHGQPLFGDVDRFLRERGFVLWRLQQLVHYGLHDIASEDVRVSDVHYFDSRPVPVAGEGGQLFWGHAYFVPAEVAFPHTQGAGWHWQRTIRAACAATAFGFVDLALSLLGAASDAQDADVAEVARLRTLLNDGVPVADAIPPISPLPNRQPSRRRWWPRSRPSGT